MVYDGADLRKNATRPSVNAADSEKNERGSEAVPLRSKKRQNGCWAALPLQLVNNLQLSLYGQSPSIATEWNVLNLGAGVQSSTLALMAAAGRPPSPVAFDADSSLPVATISLS